MHLSVSKMTLAPSSMLPWFRDRRFWAVASIILLGRLAWAAYWGVLLEIDSLGYLELQATLSHPPLYAVFCALLLRIVDSLEAVILGQCLVYSLAAALFLQRHVVAAPRRYWLALALALEPLSGKLACTVMAETLFLSLLIVALALLPPMLAADRRRWQVTALAIGLLLGAAYLTRYAAPVFGLAIVGWLAMRGLPWRRVVVAALLILLGFQAAILPLRLYYQVNFGTLAFNGFSSLSVWNTAAYLYTAAKLEPQNDFERSLTSLPSAKFELYETWHTNQIFHDSCAYVRYTLGMPTAEKLAAARAAGQLGWRLLAGAPLRHMQDFVLPNIIRPFSKTDTLYANLLPPRIQHGLHYQPHQMHIYYPAIGWVYFALLLAGSIGYFQRRKTAPAIVGALLLSCWLYLAGIAVLTVIFLRFVYLLGPLILLILGLLGENASRAQSSSR
jgi:Dolichyl-phosphate-mannose-protein mannosyltransferase